MTQPRAGDNPRPPGKLVFHRTIALATASESCQNTAPSMNSLPLFLALLAALSLRAAAETPLAVSAATSLRDVLAELKTLYATEHADVTLTLDITGSGSIQRQIENGAAIDVFISASTKEIFALEKKELLVHGSIRNIVRNTLVLIVPKENSTVNSFADLAKPEVRRIAIGEPRSVAVGSYTIKVIAFLKLTGTLAPKLLNLLDVQQILTTVGTGDAEAGFVYSTDARRSDKVRIADTAKPGMHQLILYPAAIPKASKQKAAAREFIAFLTSPAARAVFEKYDFLPPP